MTTFLSLCLLFGVPDNPNPWEEMKEVDGVRVLARDVPGSNVREVKAEAVVAASAETIWAVLADIPHYPEFMPYVIEAKIIAGDAGANAQYEYQLIDPPLVDRRDYTLKVVTETHPDAGRYRRYFTPANDKGPAVRDGVVRITTCEGYWLVERQSDHSATVTYWLYTDPGGAIPAWMANKANSKSVPDLMRAVRSRSLNPKWRRD